MTNQQHLILALGNMSVAIANNSTLKKYAQTCLFVIACDGKESIGTTIVAGHRAHMERHFFSAMCADPMTAVTIKRAFDKAMQEPEIAAKIESLQREDEADDVIRGVFNKD